MVASQKYVVVAGRHVQMGRVLAYNTTLQALQPTCEYGNLHGRPRNNFSPGKNISIKLGDTSTLTRIHPRSSVQWIYFLLTIMKDMGRNSIRLAALTVVVA
jgi:hypothetical protein